MPGTNFFKKNIILLILALNFLLRLTIMLFTNLGNDEVYYVQYALNPSLSHFDHPPLVGLLIRFSTFNLHYIYNDFFIRLGPLLIGTANLYLIYKIGELLKNKTLGLVSALLYSSSFYISIVVGTFILPDTPLSIFWLLSLFAFLKFLRSGMESTKWLLVFGIFCGFALLAKYQAVFLWVGATGFMLIYSWRKLFSPAFLLSCIISLLIFSPVLWWNLTSEYSGFNYHTARVGNSSWLPAFKHFLPELLGQIFYNNPFIVALIVVALLKLFRQKFSDIDKTIIFLLLVSIPLIIIILVMSLYNKTLPHWSGPSYFALILIAAMYFVELDNNKIVTRILLKPGVMFSFLTIITGLIQVKTGVFSFSNHMETEKVGKNDFTIDIGLWEKISEEIKNEIDNDETGSNYSILTHNWFPAAHIDYYYAIPNKTKLYVLGGYKRQHEYIRINRLRGSIQLQTNAYYISTSNYYKEPEPGLLEKFESASARKTIPVKNNGKTAVNLFIWKLTGLNEPIDFEK